MMRPLLDPVRAVPLAAALSLFSLAGLSAASGQGTPEQRAACAPDAIRLCQDTIPDVGRTTACMRTHQAELSPACRTAFLGATGGKPAAPHARRTAKAARREEAGSGKAMRGPARQRTARLAPPADDDMPGPRFVLPSDRETRSDARRARVVVRRLCRNDVLDADTCAFTNRVIDLAR